MLKRTSLFVCTLVCIFFLQNQLFGQTTTFGSGTAIIDMGSATPTVKNSLKPYGLIYTLLKNNHVPVSVVVNSSKVKDGIDFVYNGKGYKGGTFIVSAEYISSEITAVLNTWINQGVLIDFTSSDLTVNVTYKINFIPSWVMDKNNGSIGVGFLNAAGIPSSAYSFKTPAQLGGCDDLFVLPHADPTYANHGNLLAWNRDQKGAIWAGCHAVSVLENLINGVDPATKMNFLSTNGLVPFTDHNPTSTPFQSFLPGDPVGQYFGKTDNGQLTGSETVYLPKVGSAWRASAKILTTSPSQADLPSLDGGAQAVENIYGRAFGVGTNGYVAYQASHNIGGSNADQIAAQRIFFNFSLFALNDKVPPIINIGLGGQPTQIKAGQTTGTITANNLGAPGTVLTSYKWTVSPASAGTLSASTASSTTFTASAGIVAKTTVIISCVVTEGCGRVSFDSKSFTVIPDPGGYPTPATINKSIPDACDVAGTITFNVFDSNVDANAGARTMVTLTGLTEGTVLSSTNGNITFTPGNAFKVSKGTSTGTYTLSNDGGATQSGAGTINITLGDATLVPVVNDDAATALVNSLTAPIDVLANDKTISTALNADGLYIRDIPSKPTKGVVYITADGRTLRYLSNSGQSGIDNFTYQACNTTGYCKTATLSVTLVDNCGNGSSAPFKYQSNQTLTPLTATISASSDSYMDALAGNQATNFGSNNPLIIRSTGGGTSFLRPLIAFSTLSATLTSTTVVVSATLSLTTAASFTHTGSAGTDLFPLTVQQLVRPFTETSVTHLTTDGTTTWGTAGASNLTSDITNTGIVTFPFVSGTTVALNEELGTGITSIVQSWVNTPSGNFGIRMNPPTGRTSAGYNFFSRESGATAPRLLISYYPCLTRPTSYAPAVYPDAVAVSSALTLTISPLTNDVNYYGNTNLITLLNGSAVATVNTISGTASITGGGTQILYTPSGSFVGIDTLTYTVADQTNGITTTGTIRITVSRSAPTLVNDVATVNSGTLTSINVGANDVGYGGIGAPIIITNATKGVAVVNGSNIDYTPAVGFVGVDVFTYRRIGVAADACTAPLSSTATVTITVNNQPPVSPPGTINTFSCVSGSVKIIDIASDPEGGALSATIVTGPTNGTAVANADGTLSYTPTGTYTGLDAFTYTVTDPLAATSVAGTVSVSVVSSNPNIAPIAVNDSDNTLADQPVYTNVLINDSDPNRDILTVTTLGLAGPISGTISIMPNKLIKYQPNASFVGTDSYQYKITDTHGGCSVSAALSAIATVTITVKAINTSLSGTVWNDVDKSAAPGGVKSFSNIKTNTETGTNGSGSLYVYLIDNTNTILDKTPVDVDGTYSLSSVPSLTSNLTLILSIDDIAIGSTLSSGSVPIGYVNTTPVTRSLPITTSTEMSPYDWGIYSDPTLFPGTIIGGSLVCSSSAVPTAFTSTASASGGSITATGYVYQWQSSTTSGSAGFANIAGAITANYTPSVAIAATTYFRRNVSTNLNATVSSNVITVTFVNNPTISINPVVGTIASGGNIVLTATGGDIYAWSPATGLSSTTTAAITANPLSTTMYTVTGTLSPSGCVNTSAITITVINPGTIGTNQTSCGTFTPAALTSIAAASDASGTAGFTYQWQSSVTSSTTGFSNIGAAVATGYVPSGAITLTTYYRRVASSGGVSVNSNVVTATVTAIPTISILPTSITIQQGFTSTLTASGATSYAWSPSTGLSATNTAAVVAGPVSSITYTVTGTSSGCTNTADIVVTVIDPGTIGSSQVNCGPFKPAPLTSTSDASGTGTITYQWQSSTTSATTGFSNIALATTAAYAPSATITATTYYRRVATGAGQSYNSNVVTATVNTVPVVAITPTGVTISAGLTQTLTASGATTYAWSPSTGLSSTTAATVIASPTSTITYIVTGTVTGSGCTSTGSVLVTVFDPGIIGSNQANCGPFKPAQLTSTADASGTGTITYQWQSSNTSATTGFSNIASATTTTYAPSATITATTYYRRVATGTGQSYNSNVVTATVNTIPVVAITPTGVTISAGLTQTFTASGATTYAWSPSTGLSSTTAATVIASPVTTTTYTITGTVTASGCTSTGTITVTVLNPGTIGSNQANCGPFKPAALTSITDASGTGTITYQWQSSTTSSTTGFSNIASATTTAYAPSATITTTTYYRRVATGAGKSYNSNVITATVNAIPVVSIVPTSVIISAGLTQTFTASGATSYVWSPATDLSSTTTAVVIASPATTTTYTVTGTINTSGCTGTGSVLITVVSPGTLIPGIIGSPQTICSATAAAAFTSTAASGGLGTINYQWQQSTDNVSFTNIVGATSVTYDAGTLSQTTYYRRGASTSSDPVVYTLSMKITVTPRPVIVGGINGPCAMPKDTIKTFSVTPAVNATNYVWTIPSTGGWSGTSTTNTIDVKAGTTNGTISVTPYNGTCAGNSVNYTVSIIDYAKVTISGAPVTASGNNNNPIKVTIQLIDILGNVIGCSGGPATLCTNSGTFTTVVDNGDGTYTSYLTSSANDVTVCGAVAGVQISQTTKVTFTGPQGGIKSNGPILDFEIPKITFTATEGRTPFTVIYHSAKSAVGKNDTLTNVTSGVAYPVKLIPSTTLYTLVSVIDANNERRDNNFIRDTTTTIVLAPKVIITLKADTPKKEPDSTWATRIVVHTKNIGNMDLSNSQARLNLRTVFPAPVTYVLDSVRVSGLTVVPNRNYDGILNEDLFAKLNNGRRNIYNSSATVNALGMAELAAPDGSANIEMWSNAGNGQEENMNGLEVVDDGHSIYMFGPMSSLPIDGEANIILWLHVKPNGYTEPFVMQAVALGTGTTEGATALTTSLSNDNEDVDAHPEITKKGDPLPAIINLFPIASIGAALSAGTPVLQGDGTYNVTLSYNVKNYGNLNLKNVQLSQDLLRSIGSPSTFNVVGSVTSTGNLIPNPGFNAKSDTNMLLPINSILGYKQESTLSYVINITPNQLSSIYRLQAIASGYSDDILATVTDLSNDGTEPDTDGNNIPSEHIITTIVINQPVPPLVPGNISTPAASCVSATGVTISQTTAPSGGLDSYQYLWQSSLDNITFFDIIGAESSSYTTGLVNKNTYYRRATISGSQVKYSNAILLRINPAPTVPVITGTGSMVVGKGNITLTAPLSAAYAWSTGATTRSIFVQDAGNYGLTITDANGCTAIATAFAITALDPGKVADVQKILSKAPALQADGSFLLSFNILASNLRTELLDSVRLKDDLSKVFPTYSIFSIVDIKASGALIANNSYDGKTQIDLLNDVSKLSASKTDSVQITIKVFPNGFAGTLNNVVNLTGRSPFGTVAVASNDPVNNANPAVRLPTKFVIPAVDIFIPSGYSPNRDGINDNFVIIRPFNTTINLEIFNRWSNLVYKSADYKNDWAGKGNQANRVLGEDLPDGTYYYVVLATDKTTGSVRKFAGVVTLKR